jgi:hypothetical protein
MPNIPLSHKRLISSLCVAGAVWSLAFSGQAQADITITLNPWSPDGYKPISDNGTVAGYSGTNQVNLDTSAPDFIPASIGSDSGDGLAGASSLTGLIAGQAIQAYCIDVFHTIEIGNQSTFTYNAPISASNAVASGGAVISSSTMYRWTQTQINEITELLQASQGVTDGNLTAAFQIAIWEVEYDQGATLTVGSTFMNFADGSGNGLSFLNLDPVIVSEAASVLATAQTYANIVPPKNVQLWELANENIAIGNAQTGATIPQALIYLVTTTDVPEPGSVGLMGTGVAALWAALRRRRSARAVSQARG